MANFLHWSVYYAASKVLVPTSIKTTDGVRIIVDPMEVVGIDNTAELKHTILTTFAKGNPIVPHPSQEEMSKPTVFYKKLGFKSYKMFNSTAILWTIDSTDDQYEIIFHKVPEDGRGFVSDLSKTITFPISTPVETVVDKLIEIIQETHREQIAAAAAK